MRAKLLWVVVSFLIVAAAAAQTAESIAVEPEGEFSVGGNGEALYSIELDAPRGISETTGPNITLEYSSQRDDGQLGVGWQLEAASTITRCAAIPAIDSYRGTVTYTDRDRYCVDGQRLINVKGAYGSAGSQYRTELETWRLFVASSDLCGSGPCSFSVTNRDGSTAVYGSGSSAIKAVGRSDVRAWAIAKSVDNNGNAMDFSYTQAPVAGATSADGDFYLSAIDYTSNAAAGASNNRSVKFVYTARPLPQTLSSYLGGSRVFTRAVLSNVQTFVSGTIVSDFRIHYATSAATGRPIVDEVQRYSGTATDSPRLSPTRMTRQGSDRVAFGTVDLGPLLPGGVEDLIAMDVNGDGRGDLVTVHSTSSKFTLTPLVSTGTALQACASLDVAKVADAQFVPVQLNNDGRGDLVYLFASGGKYQYLIYNGTQCGFTAGSGGAFTGLSSTPAVIWPMDVNGDGFTDISAGLLIQGKYTVANYLGSKTGFTLAATSDIAQQQNERFWPADANGDGMMDLVQAWHTGGPIHLTTFLSDGTKFGAGTDTTLTAGAANLQTLYAEDLNGDGNTDIVHGWSSSGTLQLSSYVASGAGAFVCEQATASGIDATCTTATGVGLTNAAAFWPMDVNGDGRVDLVQAWQNGTQLSLVLYRNANTGFDSGTAIGTNLLSADIQGVRPIDLTGDGKTDLVQMVPSGTNVSFIGYLSNGPVPDLADTITNAVGGKYAVAYKSMSDPSVYTPGSAAGPTSDALSYIYRGTPSQAPFQQARGGRMQLVSQTTESNDPQLNASTYSESQSFTYAGGLVDAVNGRGWLGFRTSTSTSEGKRTVTVLNQEFPKTGTTAEIRSECLGALSGDPRCPKDKSETVLSATFTFYDVVERTPGVYEVLRNNIRSEAFTYGAYEYTRETAYRYDQYGNNTLLSDLGYVDRQGNDIGSDAVYTCSAFDDKVTESGWSLGYLAAQKVSARAECFDFDTFSKGVDFSLEKFTYTAKRNLETRSQYDDTSSAFLVTRYGYDAFGHVLTETLPGNRTITYAFEMAFNTWTQSITMPPNDAGVQLVERMGFDPRFDVQVAAATPAGHVGIMCVDPFGRINTQQMPMPQEPANVKSDTNCVPAGVTGDASRFKNAAVVTGLTAAPQRDASKRILVASDALQSWTIGSATPSYLGAKTYTDGRGRDYLQTLQQESGVVAVCTNFNAGDEVQRESLPHLFSGDVACTSTSGDSAFLWSTETRDAYGRPIQSVQPAGTDGKQTTVAAIFYDTTLKATITRAEGAPEQLVKILQYDYFNSDRQLVKVIAPQDGNATTTYGYDLIGRMTSSVDPPTSSNPNGVTTLITYDSLDRRTSLNDPDQNTCFAGGAGCVTGRKALLLAYDATTGLLSSTTDAKGQVTQYRYDKLGRETAQILAAGAGSGEIKYTYDQSLAETPNGSGQLTTAEQIGTDGKQVYRYRYGYDVLSNPADTALDLDGGSYKTHLIFDPQGRIQSEKYPDGFVATSAYAFGNLASIASGATTYGRFANFTATQEPQQIEYGNGVKATLGYSPMGQPVSFKLADSAAATIADSTVDWNKLYQVTGSADRLKAGGIDRSLAFQYALTRLNNATGPYGSQAFGYDASGNLTSKDGYAFSYQAHRLTSGNASGKPSISIGYDLNGNMQSKQLGSDAWTFDYDVLNRLRSVQHEGSTIFEASIYDDDRRLKKTTADGTVVLYVSPHYEVTRLPGGTVETTKYLGTPEGAVVSITTANAVSSSLYFHRDWIDSVAMTTGEDGLLETRMSYLPYGGIYEAGVTGPDDFRLKFQNKELDEDIDLYYFGARYYDPSLGRFISPDPELGSEITDFDTLNRFAFALNNPATLTDPTGNSIWENIVGAIVGALEIIAGVAINIISGGTLSPLGNALIGAGTNAVLYSATADTENFSWAQYGIEQATGVIFGIIPGGNIAARGARAARSVATMARRTASTAARAESRALSQASKGASLTARAEGRAAGRQGSRKADDLLDLDVCFASFPVNTPVWTASGQVPIGAVDTGDAILSRNSIDGTQRAQNVTAVKEREASDLINFCIAGDGGSDDLVVTPNHPFFIEGRGWVSSEDVRRGDRVAGAGGTWSTVTSATRFESPTPTRVASVEVGGYHSYFVGEQKLWVHNAKCEKRVTRSARASSLKKGHDPFDVKGGKRVRRPPARLGFGPRRISRRVVDFGDAVLRDVNITYTGTYAGDFAAADLAAGITKAYRNGRLLTWHHVEKLTQTANGLYKGRMQLIQRVVHDQWKHYGGVEEYRRLANGGYR